MGAHGLSLHVLLLLIAIQSALASSVASLKPGFRFDYVQPGRSFPVPVTSQCERIRLKWARDGNSTGPSPVAPYFVQVFSSESSQPYNIPAGNGPTFDWDVPFAPNTQYQMCMFDTSGISGGCGQVQTVIANSTTSTPSCQNVTNTTPLWVSGSTPLGALPQHGYINQCQTLSIRPNNGSPPFTLTVAPSGHAPYNMTSKSMNAISWPVSLPEGAQFFLSMHSSDGQSWSNGPLWVGGSGPDSCLSPGSIRRKDFNVYIICSTIGGTCFGLLAGILAYILFLRVRKPWRKAPSQKYLEHPYDPGRPLRTGTPNGSIIGGISTIGHAASLSQSPRSASETLLPMTPPSRMTDSPPPLEPLRPVRAPSRQFSTTHSRQSSRSRLNTSFTPLSESSEATSSRDQLQYPTDVKRPPRPDESPLLSRDESSSIISGSTRTTSPTPALHRSTSTRSRAPTYVADPPPMPLTPPPPMPRPTRSARGSRGAQAAFRIQEEYPPQYGNHTADHTLNYDPNILSSGTRL
jgi:hypothetical protein